MYFKMNKKVLQGKETKKKLLDCAKKLFEERGYSNVTVDDIIKESGSSKGGFYTHFKTKELLLIDIFPLVDDVYTDFISRENLPENSIDKISLFLQYVFEFIEKRVGLEFISVIYSAQIKDLSAERIAIDTERKYYNILSILIEEGKKKNEIVSDMTVDEIKSVFTTCIRGAIYDWCLYKGDFSLSDYGNKILNILLNRIKI